MTRKGVAEVRGGGESLRRGGVELLLRDIAVHARSRVAVNAKVTDGFVLLLCLVSMLEVANAMWKLVGGCSALRSRFQVQE